MWILWLFQYLKTPILRNWLKFNIVSNNLPSKYHSLLFALVRWIFVQIDSDGGAAAPAAAAYLTLYIRCWMTSLHILIRGEILLSSLHNNILTWRSFTCTKIYFKWLSSCNKTNWSNDENFVVNIKSKTYSRINEFIFSQRKKKTLELVFFFR